MAKDLQPGVCFTDAALHRRRGRRSPAMVEMSSEPRLRGLAIWRTDARCVYRPEANGYIAVDVVTSRGRLDGIRRPMPCSAGCHPGASLALVMSGTSR